MQFIYIGTFCFLCIGLFFWSTKSEAKIKRWSTPRSYFVRKKRVGFLFAPGVLHDDSATIRYCKRYTTSAGLALESQSGFEVLDSKNCCACVFPEIVIRQPVQQKKKKKQKLKGRTLPKLFYRMGSWFRDRKSKKKYGTEPNALVKQFDIDLNKLNIAQEDDINALMNTYHSYIQTNAWDNVVLYGFSRGAATTFNFMSTKYKLQDAQCVKAVVLQGCFDTMTGTLNFKRFDINKFLSRMLPKYTSDRVEPINLVKDFPRNIPILFITSKADEVVPAASTQRLAYALKDTGHQNVYLLTVESSPHSRYTSYNKEEMDIIERVVHAFYHSCGLSHIRYLAKEGKTSLETCRL